MHLDPTAPVSCLCGGVCRCMHGPSHIMLLLRRRRRRARVRRRRRALCRAPCRRARWYPPPTRCPTRRSTRCSTRRADRALVPARLRGQLCGISRVTTVGAPRRRLLNCRRALPRPCSRQLRQCSRPLRQCSRPLRPCGRQVRQVRQLRPRERRPLASSDRRQRLHRPIRSRPTQRPTLPPTQRPTQRPTQCPHRRRTRPSTEMLPRGVTRMTRRALCSGRAVRS